MQVILLENAIISSLVFLLLNAKARISIRHMYRDNVFIIIVSSMLAYLLQNTVLRNNTEAIIIACPIIVLVLIFLLILFRFYRNPERKHNATARDILAPADGFICYVKRIDDGIPISVKGKNISRISELSRVDILRAPCWLIGTTMTLFDVHYVRSPVRGKVILDHYTKGKFLSLKRAESESENERNTTVIENEQYKVGVIQIASKRVRGIRTYVRNNQHVEMGQRIGMITFGSQADVIFPDNAMPAVEIGQWVYGGKTIIASLRAGSESHEYPM